MTTRDIWNKLDKTVQDKFEGKLGKAAFRESAVIVFMLATHKTVSIPLTPQQEKELDRLWYGSLAQNHPLHKVRVWVQERVGDWAQSLDDLTGRHLQHKFEWFDTQVPHVRAYIQKKAAPPR
jgi:hypothetical protein